MTLLKRGKTVQNNYIYKKIKLCRKFKNQLKYKQGQIQKLLKQKKGRLEKDSET